MENSQCEEHCTAGENTGGEYYVEEKPGSGGGENRGGEYYVEEKSPGPTEEDELIELLEQKDRISQQETDELRKELEQLYEEAKNNVNIFTTFMENFLSETKNGRDGSWSTGYDALKNLYREFSSQFDERYRSDLFENIYNYFNDQELVTDQVVLYWKLLIINLLASSRKYRSYLGDLTLDGETYETNFRLVPQKHIFRCFVDEDHICYFKENGNSYYVS